MKTLLVGGYFDGVSGKKSSIIAKMAKLYPEAIDIINGGNYDTLKEEVLPSTINYDVVIWMAEVNNNLPKVRDVKEINPKCILVTSKRNDGGLYSFEELISKSLQRKANLTIEIQRQGTYNFMLFDPLGNAWTERIDSLEELVSAMYERIVELKAFTRKGTKEFTYTPKVEKWFLDIVHSCADDFHKLINPPKEVGRFLGNASFRCTKGFPSFKDERGMISVSKRNIDKRYITVEDFVSVENTKDAVTVYGSDKPSVDTPVQLKLYQAYPYVKYMIHGHVYVKGAPFTSEVIPCGALEEVASILKTLPNPPASYDSGGFAINLLGHGCILFAWDLMYFAGIEFYARSLPELIRGKRYKL